MFLALLLFLDSAIAQDDAERQERIKEAIEGTRSLEDQFSKKSCERGDVLACLRLAGLHCAMSDIFEVTICTADGMPVYKLTLDKLKVYQGEMPKKWTIEVIQERQPASEK